MSKQLYPESVVTADVDGVVRWALNAHPDDTSVGAITSRYMAESNLLKEFEGRTLNADEQRKHDRIEKDVEKLASAAAKLSSGWSSAARHWPRPASSSRPTPSGTRRHLAGYGLREPTGPTRRVSRSSETWSTRPATRWHRSGSVATSWKRWSPAT